MSKQTIALLSDEVARELAAAAYQATLARFPTEPDRHVWAATEARLAVLRAYPHDTFCVRVEKPIHQRIRRQAQEAANAAVAVPS